jgi:hypothetical protein
MHVLRTRTARALGLVLILVLAATLARPQSVQTTTVTGTVYAAGGAPVSGTIQISWPAFTTAAGQAIAAGRVNVNIPANGQISVGLTPNIGAMPAGLYYTAVYHLADGTTSTEYWVVPNSIQATVGQVRAKLMPSAQAVQAVSKAYVDQSISQAVSSQISPSGGTLIGPLYLSGDPSQPGQAANKHYVDNAFAGALPLGGGVLSGPVTAKKIGAVFQADQFPVSDFGAQLQACINALDPNYGGTCDARNFGGSLNMASNLTVSRANVTINLPCSTIATAASIMVPAGTRNVTLHGCASRGTSAASGAQGGTVFLYSGSSTLLQVGDPSFAADTKGFRLDNAALNTTAAQSAAAQAIAISRTQEISLASLYLLGNGTQTALTLDGTGNYTGGTFEDLQFTGYQTAVNAIGHTISNPATSDWLNASAFVRMHIDCPTSSGSPIAGTVGINLAAGDGNTITGGDVESCSTALHLGPQAQNNTILGLRNENSTTQIQADPGSSYNNWITGGTMFTGKLVDQGTRNSFLDTFHRSFNALNGDWYGSQQDATVTNHFRLGTGTGNERGMLDRYQTDSGYRWTTGLSDAAAGEQYYQVLDELNSVYRLSIGQYNNGQSSTNNQTSLNSAGSGAVILNGSNNAGTGGVVFGSGGPASTTVATIDKSGNAHFTGTLLADGTSQSTGTMTVRNNTDSEVDYYLWPGATSSQKGSFTYKDFNGASQWYMLKDQNNNWALNSAVGGIDSFKAYQSSNSGDTYINAANPTGHIRLNYEAGAGAETDIYSGASSSLAAAFLNPTAIKFPGLAASSGKNCLQIDISGYITNTTAPCSSGSGSVGSGSSGQIAYYTANGTAISGTTTVPLAAGGTGAATAAAALANLGALPLGGGTLTGQLTATQFNGPVKGNVTGDVALASGLTFADSSVQTSSQQGALTGSANDSTARSAANAAQSAATQAESDAQTGIAGAAAAQVSANSAQTAAQSALAASNAAQGTASTALPANGATSTGSGSANVVAFPGAVAAGSTVTAPNLDMPVTALGCSAAASNNDTCLQAALAWAAAHPNSSLYVPPGTFQFLTPLAWTASATLRIRGAGYNTSALYYAGTANGSAPVNQAGATVTGDGAALYVNNGPGTGFGHVDLRDVAIGANTSVQYAFLGTQIGQSQMENVAFSGGSVSSFEGKFWNSQSDLRNLKVIGGGQPNIIQGQTTTCVNGLSFDQGPLNGNTSSMFASNNFSLTMPTVEFCSGIGLNLAMAASAVVNGGQISTNHQNLYVNCTSVAGCNANGNSIFAALFESGSVADQAYGAQLFANALFSGIGLQTFGPVVLENTQLSSLTAMTGYLAPTVRNIYTPYGFTNITDNSKDGIQVPRYMNSAASTTPDPTAKQEALYAAVPGAGAYFTPIHATYTFLVSTNGTYNIGSVPVTLGTAGWDARVKGTLAVGASPSTSWNRELTPSSPTVTFPDGGSLTLGYTSGHPLTWTIANETAGISGQVDIEFRPATAGGYAVPVYAEHWKRPVYLQGGFSFDGSRNITGLQGIGANLFSATGTFTTNHLVAVDANGTAKDSGVAAGGLAQSNENFYCQGVAGSSNTYMLAAHSNGVCTTAVSANAGISYAYNTTLSNLVVRCAATGVNTSSGVFTIYTQAVGAATMSSSALTATYGTATAQSIVQDTTHTVSLNAGDIFQIRYTTQASETLANCSVSVEVQPR